MKKVLQQDECAPDSLEYFEKDFIKETNFSLRDFISKSELTTSEDKTTITHSFNEYVLKWSCEDPFWTLYKKQDYDSLPIKSNKCFYSS